MKLCRTRRDHSIAFNMTPMIDIVFLLIIFFMTVSQITRTVDHAVDLPSVAVGVNPGVKPATVTLNIDREGKIIVAGRLLSEAELKSALEKQLGLVNGNISRVKIQIRIDKNCESKFVSSVIEMLEETGFSQLRIAVAED